MKRKRLQYWANYANALSDHVGLRDWQIRISRDTCEEPFAAIVEPWYGRKVASIKLNEDWDTDSPEEQRGTMVHELLHCHINPIRDVFDTYIEHHQDDIDLPVFRALMHKNLELAIDGIATILAPFLPLPPAIEPESEVAA